MPWESCLTLGADFTYEYGDRYKTPRELVNLLVNIVANGRKYGPQRKPAARRPYSG